jgi:hypothetical protein
MSRIFSVFFILLVSFSATAYAANQNNYLVENVDVKVTGKSPSGARNAANANARRDAFLILLTRLEMNVNIADHITDDEISYMVRSEQIDKEKIAGNSYSATFNIMFAKDFVDHVLAQKTSQKVKDKQQESYLLIPAKLLKNKKLLLWEDENDWKKAIAQNLVKRSDAVSQKFILPEADMQNIASLNRDNVTNIDYPAIEPVVLKYNSNAAYSLIFFYDEIENKVTINLFYIRKLQKKQVRLSFVNVDRLGYEALLDKVAAKTIDYLINSQSGEDKVLSSNIIRFEIPISSIGNWLTIKDKIENSNLINQLNIEAISRDYALISVNYIGNIDINEAFSGVGFSLSKKSENFYRLTKN